MESIRLERFLGNIDVARLTYDQIQTPPPSASPLARPSPSPYPPLPPSRWIFVVKVDKWVGRVWEKGDKWSGLWRVERGAGAGKSDSILLL